EDVRKPVGTSTGRDVIGHAAPTNAVLFENVVGTAGTHVDCAAGEPHHVLVERERVRRVRRVQLVPEEAALTRGLVGRVARGALDRAVLGPLGVGYARGPADAGNLVGR